MEKYNISVVGKKNNHSHSFTIDVEIIPTNFPGGFIQWIGNSRNKEEVSAWLSQYCHDYTELKSAGVRLKK